MLFRASAHIIMCAQLSKTQLHSDPLGQCSGRPDGCRSDTEHVALVRLKFCLRSLCTRLPSPASPPQSKATPPARCVLFCSWRSRYLQLELEPGLHRIRSPGRSTQGRGMFADVRCFQELTDGNGDAYYGGSMYYGDGTVKGAGAKRTW